MLCVLRLLTIEKEHTIFKQKTDCICGEEIRKGFVPMNSLAKPHYLKFTLRLRKRGGRVSGGKL